MADVVIEPSVLIGDATCPRCGHLLWFVQTPEITRVFDARRTSIPKDRIIDAIADQLGVDREKIINNPTFWDDVGADSLDTVELIAELDEEFGPP